MNYYIQGNKGKAEQIKAAFEKLGFICTLPDCLFGNERLIFLTSSGVVYSFYIYKAIYDIIKTHPDYKELELPVKPKFKVGDYIIWNGLNGGKPSEPVKIIQLIDKDQLYMVDMSNGVGYAAYDMQDHYELVQKPHYDIANFHAGMPVLVRIDNSYKWSYTLFSHYNEGYNCPFSVASCCSIKQCIPFEGNEHLLGTTDMCDEQYINW